MDLQDKVALVTGSARRVGKAIAIALAREGAHLIVHYGRSEDEARQTAEEIAGLGVEAFPVQADLGDPDQIVALFEAAGGRFGRLDVLVNSAASFEKRDFDAITLDDWERVLAVNLRAPFLCTQHAARLMRVVDRPAGQPALIANIVDLSGVYPWRGYAHHGVSKAGLLHLTRIAARELAPGIRVNAIAPGPILPPPGMDSDGEAWRRIGESVPLARPGDPAQIGQTVVYLAANDYVTGTLVNVDGGEHLLGPANH
jgi:pteridine reductase